MARFPLPLADILNNPRKQPEPGERALLEYLDDELNDEYEIYYEPFLNLCRPDIVILKRHGGVFIIEVKDWQLSAYEMDEENNLHVRNDRRYTVRNPFQQVRSYKKELITLCTSMKINELLGKKCGSRGREFGLDILISTGVYFHNERNTGEIRRLFNPDDKGRVNGTSVWPNLNALLRPRYNNLIDRIRNDLTYSWKREAFTDEIYEEMRYLLSPSLELREQSLLPELDARQKKLAESADGRQQKVIGVAGSGKTLILAKKAVNAFQRTGEPVLIVTFNITMKNYIADKIAQLTRDMGSARKENFQIVHFHGLLSSALTSISQNEARNNVENWTAYAADTLNRNQNMFPKYRTVLIDEGQDFEKSWFVMLKSVFLKPEIGEYMIFADAKQDIYEKIKSDEETAPEDKENFHKPKVNIPGRWSYLTESHRMSPRITGIVNSFANTFFSREEDDSEITCAQLSFDDMESRYQYYRIRNFEDVFRIQREFSREHRISPNDIAILVSEHSLIRKLDALFTSHGMRVQTTSELDEDYYALREALARETYPEEQSFSVQQYREIENSVKFRNRLKEIRTARKQAFRMNPGCIKISTIESFKGWEIYTLFLLLDSDVTAPEDIQRIFSEKRIYTAMTRAKQNLIVLDCGVMPEYSEFFRNIEQDR